MSRNPYVDLCLMVQATRRDLERRRSPLAPAIGVAASIYTHQLANIHRVLTDLRVRHLLADEVGLGKTVQALMVLNALRSDRPSLRALVIVPDRLVPQWRDEIMTRAHTAPIGEDADDEREGGQYIRLAWEAQLKTARWSLADIDPERYDVLVVDELHKLRGDVQDRIVRAAPRFDHVLILTATPAFQDVRRHAQLFALLEPERVAAARWRVARSDRGLEADLSPRKDKNLSKWPEWAAREVVRELLERDRAAAATLDTQGEAPAAAVALASCAYRRIIRTRRVDYAGVLPRRRHIPITVEPLGAEATRQALMWEYFQHLDSLSRRFDPVLLAKRVILSPPSLQQRVDFLLRKGHERDGLLQRAKPLVHLSQGDSRLDALVDILRAVWAKDPTERVLVAAQDNLTVDYLFDKVTARLPLVGPFERRVPLRAALIRQGQTEEMLEDLAGYGNDTAVNLDDFQRGDALILFAPEKAQVGLNLQRARVLILYSVPWRPEEVEQWIGRLDRIGNSAAFGEDGEARAIDVYTISQRGLVDEKVVTVLRRFHVFERSVNLDGDHLQEVAQRIEVAALRSDGGGWRDLEESAEAMAEEDEVQELRSELREHLPWTVAWATTLRRHLDAIRPAAPVLVDLPDHAQSGPRNWDRSLEGMIKLLKQTDDYHIRSNKDPDGGRFSTLWYQFGVRGMYGRRDVKSRVVFSFGADPGHERHPRHAYAFITRRGDICTPPRRHVTLQLEREQARRPLHFLSFGDRLHDELIEGWLPQAGEFLALDVKLFDDHALFEHGAPGLHVLRVSELDPAAALPALDVEERTLKAVAGAAASTPERLQKLIQPFASALRCALEADIRWLRAALGAELRLEAARLLEQGRWVPLSEEATCALLNPMAHERRGVPRASDWSPSEDTLRACKEALQAMRGRDVEAARESWSPRFPDLKAAVETRRYVARREGKDALKVAQLELDEAARAFDTAQNRGNRAQITHAQNAHAVAAELVEMTREYWSQRDRWLEELPGAVRAMQPREVLVAVIRLRKTQ